MPTEPHDPAAHAAPSADAPSPDAPSPDAPTPATSSPATSGLEPGNSKAEAAAGDAVRPVLDPHLLHLLTTTPASGIPVSPRIPTPNGTQAPAGSPGGQDPGPGQQAFFQVSPPRIWAEPGMLFLVRTFHASRFWHPAYNEGQIQARIGEEIDRLQWRTPRRPQPFDPAGVVTELVRQLPLEQITAAADNGRLELPDGPETTVYGLYGIEGLVAGVRVRVYILDGAYAAFPLAVDAHVETPALPEATGPAEPAPAGRVPAADRPEGQGSDHDPGRDAGAVRGGSSGAVGGGVPGARVCDGYVELDTKAWLAARTAGPIPALTDLLAEFEEALHEQTALHLQAAPLFITARAGSGWTEAEHHTVETGFRGGEPVSLGEDLIIHRYTDPIHGPVARVASFDGFRTGPHQAYADTATEGSQWTDDDQVDIFCPAGHAWTYNRGQLTDSGGTTHRVADLFPDGELVTDTQPQSDPERDTDIDLDTEPPGQAYEGVAANHAGGAGPAGRIICPVCGQDCAVCPTGF